MEATNGSPWSHGSARGLVSVLYIFRQGINVLLKHEEENQVGWHLGKSAEKDVDVSVAGQFTSAQRQTIVDQRDRHPVYDGRSISCRTNSHQTQQ